jgi:CRP-like cAMP-binding protein
MLPVAAAAAEIIFKRLRAHTSLSVEELAVLEAFPYQFVNLATKENLLAHQDASRSCIVLVAGIAAQYVGLPEGNRQNLAIHFPGDWIGAQVTQSVPLKFAVCGLGPISVALVPQDVVGDAILRRPKILQALTNQASLQKALLAQMVINLGSRSKPQALAHLVCELYLRAKAAGLVTGNQCPMPLTQGDLSETLGMSLVTVNRRLQQLRRTKTFELRNGVLKMLNFDKLAEIAQFDQRYLHPL